MQTKIFQSMKNDNHNDGSTNEKNTNSMIFKDEEKSAEVVEDQCEDP